ncbi:MAG: hypothetical protein HYZ73_00965 [Elusimicrobia bacterium]|nr:hypothetical protein [Elusimicrobiota bacterium]
MLVETLPWVVGGGLAVGASLRWNWWRWPQPGIPVLMYHHLGACPLGSSAERKLWVSPRQFQRQLSALQRWDYQITSLSEFSDYLAPQRFEEGQKPRTHPETLLGLQPRKGGLWRRQARSAYRSVVKYAVARLPGLGAPPEASLTEHGFGMSSCPPHV